MMLLQVQVMAQQHRWDQSHQQLSFLWPMGQSHHQLHRNHVGAHKSFCILALDKLPPGDS
jgi:hypothetical protein